MTKSNTKEIIISVASFLIYYIVVSQYILPVVNADKQPAVLIGWISFLFQVGVVILLFKKKHMPAVAVGVIFIGLQLLLQIISPLLM